MYNNFSNCNSNTEKNVIDSMPIGMAYVPWQIFTDIYTPEKALTRGTIFSQLDKPFLGGCVR